jgi:hypothetical protein
MNARGVARAWALGLALLAGCASYSGSALVPGQATEQDVVALMGEPALVRAASSGERTLWYPRLPFGRESFAARIGPDGRLLSIEQRLQPQFFARIRANQSTVDDVLDILGPPDEVTQFARKQRETWSYPFRLSPNLMTLYVAFSPDRVVREVFQLHDDEEEFPFVFMR